MLNEVTPHWWAVALRGLVAVVFGVAALVWPGITLWALVLSFGIWALVDGVVNLVAAFRPGIWGRGMLVLDGLGGIIVGVVALGWPGITAKALLYLIGAWAVVTGILKLVDAVRLRGIIENEWLLGLSGLASLAFGVIAAFQPGAGALAIVWLIGVWALVFGVLLIAFGFRLRALARRAERADEGKWGSAAGHAV